MEAPFHKAEDDSVVDATGKIVFYSTERFAKEIAEGHCCFICGAFPDETQFNNEHVIPKWILRRFNLYERSINLPNGTTIQYDQYTVPCCADCNTFLGETFEKPIQQLIDNGTSDIEHYVKSKGPWLIFLWMALIFLKTHLKDRTLRNSLDHREADGKIADLYEWENLHHIHCIVRASYVGCTLNPDTLGSFFVLPVNTQNWGEPFDYRDLYQSKTVLLRLGEVCFIAVLNDADSYNKCNFSWDPNWVS